MSHLYTDHIQCDRGRELSAPLLLLYTHMEALPQAELYEDVNGPRAFLSFLLGKIEEQTCCALYL